jgi:subtilisin family serine protease
VAALAALLAFAAVVAVGGAGAARPAPRLVLASPKYVAGEVVVRFRAGAGRAKRFEALSSESAKTIRPLGLAGLQLVHVTGPVPEAVAALASDPAVEYAEPNWTYHALALPDDPRLTDLWGLARISAPAAWDVTTGSSAVTVAVVDTGVASGHPDLAPNMVPGWDFVQNDGDPRDFNGHGTHVAGTIGARGDNGLGVAGVNWRVSLMPVRVLDGSGTGSNANVAAGFAYACAHGADVVNASLGGTSYSHAMRDAIASPACAQTLFVVAAGNDGVSDDRYPHYPCNYGAAPDDLPSVICVGATDTSDTLASFSNYGKSVDLAAPGVGVTSTWPAYDTLASDGFDDLGGWTATAAAGLPFGLSPLHVSGSFSASDSPSGPYRPDSDTWLVRSSSMASLAGRVGCRLSYDLRLDTQTNHDYLYVLGSADGTHFSGSPWTGTTGGIFIRLSTDVSALDGSPTFVPALRLVSDGDAIVADGGSVDDLSLTCLGPAGGAYATISGTSMATPHVAGVAALVEAAHPAYTVAQVKAAILGGVVPLRSLAGKVATGGRLDACRAVGCTTAFRPPCAEGQCRLGPVRHVRPANAEKVRFRLGHGR